MNLELLLILLTYSAPAMAAGLVTGAVGWTSNRLLGATAGALIGLMAGMAFWFIYLNTDLAVHFDPDELIWTGLRRGWPGILLGAAFGAALWRERRIFGALCGAIAGFVPGLLAWWLLFG